MHSKGFTDRIVEVRFVHSNLTAVSSDFEKAAFIDRFCHIKVMPQTGEYWRCIVRGDSNREDPKRGALFLKPLEKLSEEEKWSLIDRPETRVLSVCKQIVLKQVLIGKTEVRRKEWCPANKGDIQEEWPNDIKMRVSKNFDALAKDVHNIVYGAMRKELADLKKSVPWFKEYVDITVEKFERISHELSLQTEGRARQAVYADGERLGLLDRWSSAPASSFPFVIEGLNLYLSDGTKLTIHNRALGVILRWEDGRPITAKAFSSSIDCTIGDRTVLNWGDALDLKEGSHFARDYKFQWVGNWLTNGTVWLPRERPCGSEWRDYTIPAIPEEYWSLFLDGLEGKILVELLPFRQQILSRKPFEKAALTERQAKVSSVLAARMWNGTNDCSRISVGRSVIFAVTNGAGKQLCIVDNPGVGAIYIFDDYDAARALADGSLSRTQAIKDGVARIIHRNGWESRISELLS